MSNNNNSNKQEHSVDLSIVPNEFLASHRKKKGIDERDAADALKISVARLRSIESGRYKEFPSQTYVRGHLRNYSRFLQLDEEAVIAAYNISNPPVFDYVSPEKNIKARSLSKAKRSWLFVLLLASLIGLWVLAYNFLGETTVNTVSPSKESAPLDNASVAKQPVGDEKANALLDNTNDASTETVNGQGLQVPVVSVDTRAQLAQDESSGDIAAEVIDESSATLVNSLKESALLEESVEPDIVVSRVTAAELVKSVMNAEENTATEIMQAQDDGLFFNFKNPCWVKVVDASNDVLFSGLKAAGSDLRIDGNAPFSIVLGNVSGASLTYKGKALTLAPQVNGRPLRFVVDG